MIKNNKGITILTLAITVAVLAILAAATVYTGTKVLESAKLQNINTDMLLIQARVKVISEKVVFDGDNTAYRGEKLSDVSYPSVENLKNIGIIDTEDTNYSSYYIWNQSILNEFGMDKIELNSGEYFVVNYATNEVITTEGIKYDGNTYYKLSETKEIVL